MRPGELRALGVRRTGTAGVGLGRASRRRRAISGRTAQTVCARSARHGPGCTAIDPRPTRILETPKLGLQLVASAGSNRRWIADGWRFGGAALDAKRIVERPAFIAATTERRAVAGTAIELIQFVAAVLIEWPHVFAGRRVEPTAAVVGTGAGTFFDATFRQSLTGADAERLARGLRRVRSSRSGAAGGDH